MITLELTIFQKKIIKSSQAAKNIKTNIYRIQENVSTMCGSSCIGFIDFMLKDKGLLDYNNLFSPNEYEKNDKIILKHFLQQLEKSFLNKL